MQCALCQNLVNTELQALCQRSCCIACATAIAEALPRLKTQPQRRQVICMRLQERGIRLMPSDTRLAELATWGITDEQINGACDIAKESTGSVNFGYVFAILRNERMRPAKYATGLPKAVHDNGTECAPVAIKPKEDWERLGFANQADYERWQFAFDMDRRKGRKITEAESRKAWLSEAI